LHVGIEARAEPVAVTLDDMVDVAAGERGAELVQRPVDDPRRLELGESLIGAALLGAFAVDRRRADRGGDGDPVVEQEGARPEQAERAVLRASDRASKIVPPVKSPWMKSR
jgi:hypothetical protein